MLTYYIGYLCGFFGSTLPPTHFIRVINVTTPMCPSHF